MQKAEVVPWLKKQRNSCNRTRRKIKTKKLKMLDLKSK